MGNFIEQQALDFANVSLIQRDVVASVHLEDWEDVLFWDTVIQRVRRGRYNYISYSKADSGHRASGSSQCMKYVGYLSKQFFVCVDSDMNYLMQTPGMDEEHYVAQTYTYSWENHYAQAEAARYADLGLTEGNAYLHVRGHNLYDLLKSIGRQLCSSHCVDFENAVLNASLPDENCYWELRRVSADLTQILM